MKMRPRTHDCDASIDPATKQWPYLAINVDDPEACIDQCRERFIDEIAAAPVDDHVALCEELNSTARADADGGFGWLYCCSSVLCGVSFDRETRSDGQDPNVRRIVNDCHNLGYESVLDRGVPPDTFTCPPSSVYTPSEPRACTLITITDVKPTAPDPHSPSSISSSASEPTPGAELTPSDDTTTTPPGLSKGVKATIVILSALAFLALLTTLLYLLRRRSAKRRHRRSTKAAPSPPSWPSTSPSRLALPSPKRPAALSPPPRLKDRRLLPTLTGNSAPHKQPRLTFPASPICAPTTSRLVPRNENAPLRPFSPAKPPSLTSSRSSPSPESPRASAEPPARPPRPHDTPLQIPNLLAPAGPPPERALPDAPGAGPQAGIGVAVSRNSQAHARESVGEYGRVSWGSWGTRVVSPVLGENELARMGGTYT